LRNLRELVALLSNAILTKEFGMGMDYEETFEVQSEAAS